MSRAQRSAAVRRSIRTQRASRRRRAPPQASQTAPYLHDARATSLFDAIEAHGGEAAAARDNFLALSQAEQIEIIEFLGTLRTPIASNEELR